MLAMKTVLYILWAGINLIVAIKGNTKIVFFLYMLLFALVSLDFFEKDEAIKSYYFFASMIPMALNLPKFRQMGWWVDYVYLFFASASILIHYKKLASKK